MKCFAFDLGKVLLDFNYEIALNKIKNRINVPLEKVLDELFVNNFADDFEKGLIGSQDFYNKFKVAFDASITYQEFADIWSDIFTPNREMIDLAERIGLTYQIYLISNINQLHFEYLLKKYPEVFAIFDELILSYKVKSLKPEKAIYEELKKKSGYAYEDIIYIDDRHDLIHEAKQFKLSALHFTTFENLLSELKKISLNIADKNEKETLRRLRHEIKNHNKVLLVGLGNLLKSDDGVGIKIIQNIKDNTSLPVIDAGTALESYLSKISASGNDLVIFIDAATLEGEITFGCYKPDEAKAISMYFTHDTSLKLATQYLQNQKSFDILILAINGKGFSFGETLSEQARRAERLISNFFIKNFPAKTA